MPAFASRRACQLSEAGLVGESQKLQKVIEQAAIVGPTDSTVLILGEMGTGKGRIARSIHEMSARRAHPFVKVNCADIPLGLLESGLFGHERGAFTGAIAQRPGRFELAHRGTPAFGLASLDAAYKMLRLGISAARQAKPRRQALALVK